MPNGHGQIVSPGAVLEEKMKERGWTQTDLAIILGKPQRSISEIINGKKAVTPDTACALAHAFGTTAEFWMQLEGAYRLSLAEPVSLGIKKRARIYELAPIKDIAKRGWIAQTDNLEQLESELCTFFGQASLDQEPQVGVSLRTSMDGPINSAQRAWCVRARHLARAMSVKEYDDRKWDKGLKQLRRLAAWPENARKTPAVLAEMGVRFVIVEPLPRTRIDGAAFWLDDTSPVVALSVRYDRIDNFWHTLGHELSHIKHRDGEALDIDIVGESKPESPRKNEIEDRANEEAAATWIDPEELQSFIVRVGPLYSRERINQFANRLRIHPGVIVGQLQHHGLGYQAFRDALVKIRDFVTAESITDGWGHFVNLK